MAGCQGIKKRQATRKSDGGLKGHEKKGYL